MKWTDIQQIAEALHDTYPDINPVALRFTDLHNYIVELPDFYDDSDRGGERILEAIQQAWIDEAGHD